MDIKNFEIKLSNQKIFDKYKTYSLSKLETVIKKYVGTIKFVHSEGAINDYHPIGYFSIAGYSLFFTNYLTAQCGLRQMFAYFNCVSTKMWLDQEEEIAETKLNIIIFMYILKTIHKLKPQILILVSDIESSKSDVVFSYFNPPIYSGINPNSGNKINYYILNALNSNII